jgi:hypothetical protein
MSYSLSAILLWGQGFQGISGISGITPFQLEKA